MQSSLPLKFELIIVNDGSTDKSKNILESLQKKYGFVLSNHDLNRGYGASLKTGINLSNNENVVFFDADGQHSIHDLSKLLIESSTYDVCIGFRNSHIKGPKWRIPLKKLLKIFFRYLVSQDVKDATSGLRIWRRSAIRKIMVFCSDGFSFSATSILMAYFLNYRISWVPIENKDRVYGKSNFRIIKIVKIFSKLLKIVFYFEPMKILNIIIYIMILIGIYFNSLSYLQSGVSSIKGSLVLLTGFIMFLNGLLIEFIAKIQKNIIINSD